MKSNNNPNKIKKHGFFTSAHSLTFSIINPILKKYGILDSKLFSDWELIVDSNLAKKTMPLKITSSKNKNGFQKTLYIIADNSSTALLINYQKEIILEKISFYFGENFIHQIKILQNNLLPEIIKDEISHENKLHKKIIIENIEIDDNEILIALENLGEAILNKK